MGKHAAPRPGRAPRRAPEPPAAPTATPVSGPAAVPTHAGPTSHEQRSPRAATPAVLTQSAVFGAMAVVVAVIALVWSGTSAKVAVGAGLGLLAIGAVAFLVVRRTGLLAERREPAGPGAPPL